MIHYKTIFAAIILSLIWGCKPTKQNDISDVIARVDEEYLSKSDLIDQIPNNLKGEDSAQFAKQYINTWIKQKIMFHKAQLNITDETNNIAQRVQEYREALYIHTYEQFLISQKEEDIKITEQEIEEYYNNHIDELTLHENIVKIDFIQLSKSLGKNDKIERWLQSYDAMDIDNLKDYCFQYANKFYFGSNWISANDLLRELPTPIEKPNMFLTYTEVYTDEDSLFSYYVKIHDFIESGSLAPIEYSKKSIDKILRQKKRHELVKSIRNNLYKDALNKNNFETY